MRIHQWSLTRFRLGNNSNEITINKLDWKICFIFVMNKRGKKITAKNKWVNDRWRTRCCRWGTFRSLRYIYLVAPVDTRHLYYYTSGGTWQHYDPLRLATWSTQITWSFNTTVLLRPASGDCCTSKYVTNSSELKHIFRIWSGFEKPTRQIINLKFEIDSLRVELNLSTIFFF